FSRILRNGKSIAHSWPHRTEEKILPAEGQSRSTANAVLGASRFHMPHRHQPRIAPSSPTLLEQEYWNAGRDTRLEYLSRNEASQRGRSVDSLTRWPSVFTKVQLT